MKKQLVRADWANVLQSPPPLGEEEGLYTLRRSMLNMKVYEKRRSREHNTKD